MTIQRRVIIVGRVQGVGFRYFVARKAGSCAGLRGFARNRADGAVEAVFAGEERDVLDIVAGCGRGPASARIEKILVEEESVDPSLGPFEIRE
jgi:acylphosphatase